MACDICGNAKGGTHQATERMFGLGGAFTYFECENCGCLQLRDVPGNMAKFYPSEMYYSFQNKPGGSVSAPPQTSLSSIKRFRNESEVFALSDKGVSWPGRLLTRLWPQRDLKKLRHFFAHTPVASFDASILDVGCGSGELLRQLADAGFSDLTGADPYLPADIHISSSLRIFAKSLASLPPKSFDFILFNHSLEHMANQAAIFEHIFDRLNPNGVCVILIPIVSDGPWKRYGTDWVELDAPRHLYLHSKRSMQMLAEGAGLDVYHVQDDNDLFAYTGSELYRRGLTLFDHEKKAMRNCRAMFGSEELAAIEYLADDDLRQKQTGRGVFYLRRRV